MNTGTIIAHQEPQQMHVARILTKDGRRLVGIGASRKLAMRAVSQSLSETTRIVSCTIRPHREEALP